MFRIHSLIAAASLFLAASCAVGPYSGQQIDTSEVSFDGFVDIAGANVRLEAFDYGPDKFVPYTTVKASTSPTFAAGAICPNSPALYRFKGKIDLNWPFWWEKNGATYEAKVRAVKLTSTGELPLFFTANPSAGECMAANAFNNTCDFQNVAVSTCGFSLSQAVVKGTGLAPWNN